MKANKQFREVEKTAVSAVIGVILMVAITVAIAGTVYVYVTGMMGGMKDQTANIACITDSATNRVTITSSGSPIKWNNVVVTTDNTSVNWRVYDASSNPLDAPKSTSGAITNIAAGDFIEFDFNAHPGMSGNVKVTLRFIPTNTLLGAWTLTV